MFDPDGVVDLLMGLMLQRFDPDGVRNTTIHRKSPEFLLSFFYDFIDSEPAGGRFYPEHI
jgi:hypothetical protein